ncbi:MAG: site-specific DNA-methyltransferase, partial [Stutzerimonas stutzeri]
MTACILQGDAMDLLPELAAESVDCIITDPPYGETALPWDRWPPGWPSLVRRVLKKSGSMWVFGSMRMFWNHRSDFDGWRLAQDVIWEKHNGTGFLNDRFRRVHEYALHFYRDDAEWGGVYKCPQYV